MSFKHLAIFPFFVGLAPALIMLGLDAGRTQEFALDVEVEIVKIFALTGSLAAASAFDRGDYLRRAWLVYGFCYVLLLLRDLLFGVFFDHYTGTLQYLEPVLVILANACGVVGIWMLSRTSEVAGIALPGSSQRQLLARVFGVVVGLAIAGPAIYLDLGHALQGQVRSIVFVISGIGDVISLALIVPVMLTALALRGGLLLWPWGLLTASALDRKSVV